MAFGIDDIRRAQARIAPYIVRTPVLRLPGLDERLGCQVLVKAECLQTTGSFKLRGALSKVLSLPEGRLQRGVVAASSGNHGRALAWAAKQLGVPATIVIPHTAPQVKRDNIAALGAEVILCGPEERFAVAEDACARTGGTLVPPYDDADVMAGQGTIGLELAEQCPDADMVVVPLSGGGLLGGVSAAVKALMPSAAVVGAEPAALPRYSESLAAGGPVRVPFTATVADALISQMPGRACFPVVQRNVDAVVAVEDARILEAMRLLLLEGKLLAEPSSCIGMGAVLQGAVPVRPQDKVCFVVSGGNVGLEQLKKL